LLSILKLPKLCGFFAITALAFLTESCYIADVTAAEDHGKSREEVLASMERVEVVGSDILVLRTTQLGPNCWSCDVYERDGSDAGESFAFEDFGESESEAIQMALHDAHEPSRHLSHDHR
jgi:hypothetical protein